jgi:hypothetical protein
MHRNNKTILLLGAAVVLGLLAFLLLKQSGPKSTLTGADRKFAVSNINDVHQVFIADRSGNTTTLERKDGYWLYNGQWKTRPTAISNLLDAIEKIDILYKPSQAAVPNMVKSLAAQGIKVEIYDRNQKLLKAYYVGGATPDETGVFIIMEGAEEPYVGYIPGWTGNLRYRYSMKGDDWRDRSLLAFNPEQITSVTVDYPKQQNKSFVLSKMNQQYEVKPLYDYAGANVKTYRERSAESFLVGFEKLAAEAFENNNPARDSIARQLPFVIISVTDDQGNKAEARFHPIFNNDLYQDPKTGLYSENPLAERYYVDVVSSGDFMLVQDRVYRKIFAAYDFFFN